MVRVNCSKCDGKGTILHYVGIQGGTCFRCKGKGFFALTDREAVKQEEAKKRMEAAYQKQLEAEEAEMEEQKKAADLHELNKQRHFKRLQSRSKFAGEVGEEISLTLSLKRSVKTRYEYMYVLTDNQDHEFIFYGKNIPDVINPNQYEIKATIKAHDIFKGFKKTVLTNVKVLNEIDWATLSDDEIDAYYN